jgi:hypothetical protein
MAPRGLSSERGNVLVTAILLIAVMLAVGLAAMSTVDTQTEQSRRERVGESTFNLAEAALSNQIFILGRKGTGTASKQYPARCPDALSEFCPETAKLLVNYDEATHKDFAPAETDWYTWVRDNADAGAGTGEQDTFWEDSLLDSRPRYDANNDKLMWVRAQAIVRGRERAMVGLIRIEPLPITFPAYAILSGRFRTSNNGNKTLVDSGNSLGVTVRCQENPPGVIPDSNGCIEFRLGQITPNETVNTGYPNPETVDDDTLEALLDVARANGTYYTSCPSGTADGALTGDVVVLDTGGLCTFRSNAVHNSPDDPGLLIVRTGKFEMLGTANFYGLIYHPNRPPSSTDPDVVKVHGNAVLTGGVIVDYEGGVEAGSSGKQNITYDANAFGDINAFGTAGVVQNTWREITPMDVN